MARLNRFDRIAAFYDALAGMVFFGQILRSQTVFLNRIAPGSRILILGGGTGRILEPLLKQDPGVKVWYVEASAVMLAKSIKRAKGAPGIKFLHGTEADFPMDIRFDVIILPFFLDMFQKPELSEVIARLMRASHRESIWLVTDFVNKSWWHRVFLFVMYRFFNAVCGVQARELSPWQALLRASRLRLVDRRQFYADFIHSNYYSVGTSIGSGGI